MNQLRLLIAGGGSLAKTRMLAINVSIPNLTAARLEG